MKTEDARNLNRRELLARTGPACALGCLGLISAREALAAAAELQGQEVHKFDQPRDARLTTKAVTQMQFSKLMEFINYVRGELGEEELIRLLKIYSTEVGRQAGERQKATSPDTDFQTYVATFRPPRYANSLTHEVVQDTEDVFELRVTECVWATVFKEAGLDGEIGHAAVCNMDYTWPTAFNPSFKMERNRTLMQGHDHCNHRYMKVAE
jgi:hypothetical protein